MTFPDFWLGLLEPWIHVGVQPTKDGRLVFGQPEYGRGHLHYVFPPIPQENLAGFLSDFPEFARYEYLAAMKEFNGAVLFWGAMDLFGIHWGQGVMRGPGMPFNLWLQNIDRPGLEKHPDDLLLGRGRRGGEWAFYVQNAEGEIFAVDPKTGTDLQSWPNTESMICDEVARLEAIATPDGTI